MKAVITILFTIAAAFTSVVAFAQKKPNTIIREGNEAYRKQNFPQATESYNQALKLSPDNQVAQYNLGNALFRSDQFDDAVTRYEESFRNAKTPDEKARASYNRGVALNKLNRLEEAIEAYKEALRNKPTDEQARENLQKALQELKQKQNQDQQNKNDEQKDEKDKKDQNKGNQQQDEQKKEEKQKNKLSQKEVEQLMKSLEEKEKELRNKMERQQKASPVRPEKDW